MYYLGLDIGSSYVKAALVEISSGKSIGVVQEPSEEMSMFAPKNGWAEQNLRIGGCTLAMRLHV